MRRLMSPEVRVRDLVLLWPRIMPGHVHTNSASGWGDGDGGDVAGGGYGEGSYAELGDGWGDGSNYTDPRGSGHGDGDYADGAGDNDWD